MPSSNPSLRFQDILDDIERYVASQSRQDFLADQKAQDAVLHCLLRISEAAKKLHSIAEVLVPELPWQEIRDLGNVLRHDYDNVNLERIWIIADEELTLLRDGCEQALRHL